jgi:site-specific DNA recombinase
VEKALLPMDDILAKRAHVLQAHRQGLLAEIAAIERQEQMPSRLLSSVNVRPFCTALKKKMVDVQSGFAKQYLRLLVDEIRVWERKVVIRGTHASVAQALLGKKLGTSSKVPSFWSNWLPFVNEFRTLCTIPPPEMKVALAEVMQAGF